jgi:hypothetical protein
MEAVERHMTLWIEVARLTKHKDPKQLGLSLAKWLYCKADSTKEISIPQSLDHAWHMAILNTRLYREMCQDLFGKFIEHSTITSDGNIRERTLRLATGMQTYYEKWGEEPTEFESVKDNLATAPGSTDIVAAPGFPSPPGSGYFGDFWSSPRKDNPAAAPRGSGYFGRIPENSPNFLDSHYSKPRLFC